MSKLAVLDRLYTFAKTDSNSSALNKSFSFPRPVGTRKKTLHSVIFNFSINATISSISAIFLRLNVVLICTGRPISFAQRTASRVRAKDPLIPRNASWVSALVPSMLPARRASPASLSLTTISFVSKGVALGVKETLTPTERAWSINSKRSGRLIGSPPVNTKTGTFKAAIWSILHPFGLCMADRGWIDECLGCIFRCARRYLGCLTSRAYGRIRSNDGLRDWAAYPASLRRHSEYLQQAPHAFQSAMSSDGMPAARLL